MILLRCNKNDLPEVEKFLFSLETETKPDLDKMIINTECDESYEYIVCQNDNKYYIVTV